MNEYEYLTDEALEKLIASAEEELILPADDLLVRILEQVDEEKQCDKELEESNKRMEVSEKIQKPPKVVPIKKRQIQYRNYCIKVWAMAAAVILIMLVTPKFYENKPAMFPKWEILETARNGELYSPKDTGILQKMGNSHALIELINGKE